MNRFKLFQKLKSHEILKIKTNSQKHEFKSAEKEINYPN